MNRRLRRRYERAGEALAPRSTFFRRLGSNLALALLLIAVSLFVGMVGYHGLAKLAWIDAFLNASMILSGMGPVDPLPTSRAKLFAGLYALYSGLTLVATAGLILAPVLHRALHWFHIMEEDADPAQGDGGGHGDPSGPRMKVRLAHWGVFGSAGNFSAYAVLEKTIDRPLGPLKSAALAPSSALLGPAPSVEEYGAVSSAPVRRLLFRAWREGREPPGTRHEGRAAMPPGGSSPAESDDHHRQGCHGGDAVSVTGSFP